MLYAARAAALAANAHVLAAYAGALWPPLNGPLTIIVTVERDHPGQCRRHPPRGRHARRHDHAEAGAPDPDRRAGPAAGTDSGSRLPEFSAVEGVALAALYAFVGFEAATIPAGETRDPERNIPKALLLTVTGVTLLLCPGPARLFGVGHRRERCAIGRVSPRSRWDRRAPSSSG